MCCLRVHQDTVEKDNFPVACTSPVIVIWMARVTDDSSHCSDVSHQSYRKSSKSEPGPSFVRKLYNRDVIGAWRHKSLANELFLQELAWIRNKESTKSRDYLTFAWEIHLWKVFLCHNGNWSWCSSAVAFTIYPKKYVCGLPFAVFWRGFGFGLDIAFIVTSLVLWQSDISPR